MRVWTADIAGAVVLTFAGLAGYATVVRPHVVAGESFAHRQELAQEAESELRVLQGERETLRMELQQAMGELGTRSLQLRPAADLNRHLVAINDLGTSIGLKIDEMRTGAAQTRPGHVSTRIDVLGRGTYPDVARFIHEVGRQHRDTHALGLRLTAGAENTSMFAVTLEWLAQPAR